MPPLSKLCKLPPTIFSHFIAITITGDYLVNCLVFSLLNSLDFAELFTKETPAHDTGPGM